jgi:thioredoxin reductase (NADPH)
MNVELYSKDDCAFCTKAKNLLNSLAIPFTEQRLGVHFTREILLEKFPTAMTFPVVVVDGMYIGGYSNLVEECKKMDSRLFLRD